MSNLLPFVVAGLVAGSVYGLAGAGLVLTYRTSGIFNFGHGAIATAAAYLFYFLHVDHGVHWAVALVVAVVVLGPLLGLAIEPIARRLADQPLTYKVVGTVGLILLVQGAGTILYGPDAIRVAQYLPRGTDTFPVGGVNVQYGQVVVTAVGFVVVAMLYGVLRWTRIGLTTRAVVDDPQLLAMRRTNPAKVRRTSWIAGATLAAASGVLILPFIGLDATVLTLLVVQAFGAAAIGAFRNIPLAFAGGIAIGVVAAVSEKYVLTTTWLSGLPDSLPFIVLIAAMLFLPKRQLAVEGTSERPQALQWHAPANVRTAMAVVVLALLGLVPWLVAGTRLGYFTIALTQGVMILSLGLLARTSGQVSLCHATFAAVGAVTFSRLAAERGLPWPVALLLAGLAAVVVGLVVAVPATRLSGLYLALATFGFGVMVQHLFFGLGFMFTTNATGRRIPRPSIAQTDTRYYFVVLGCFVAVSVLMAVIHASRLGRVLRGLGQAPVAASTLGLSTNTTRAVVFAISAFVAAISGILYGGVVSYATAADSHFTAIYSLLLLAQLAVAPFASPWFALPAMVGAVLPAFVTSGELGNWLNVVFGFVAVAVSMTGGTPAAPAWLRRRVERVGRAARTAPATSPLPAASPVRHDGSTGLVVRGLEVRFGGLRAVDRVSLTVPAGTIVGLIGPNGAGKTSTFDTISGLNRRAGGSIVLDGDDITTLSPAARGRRGIGRTFQRMQLAESLSVRDNVILGREAALAGRGVLSHLRGPTGLPQLRAEADAALDLCEIAGLADLPAGVLSTGQRRLVELARCLAGRFRVLLLDEPSSGLDAAETAAFDRLLRDVVDATGCGVLLVEHDLPLVLNVCDYIYVLDFGTLIFEGEPADVLTSREVRAAYLGTGADEHVAELEGAAR
jgi:ABC-type branched-subunit amino acid transport system ATPase component/branched-subunit amino acid ABC-type transport system permease component